MNSTLIAAAAALAFATPAAAQPAAQPAPASTCTPEHAAMGHCTMPTQPQQAPAQAQHGDHGGQSMSHGQMADCCRDANGNGRMDCCENMAGAAQNPSRQSPAPAPAPQQHPGH